jgi:hypothetical protein
MDDPDSVMSQYHAKYHVAASQKSTATQKVRQVLRVNMVSSYWQSGLATKTNDGEDRAANQGSG